ncbi:RNA polymerase subunit sigma-70 [Nonomuraea sp. K274]|uniref:RNA polymerase subunit sigma-70 n=1 Tax=Nonomuraea cypriaca TaxID=1187855 RepID=A0A931AGK9_9ACTN|nr:RNA polymerase subunit sigma-70 [Nonomuraea cypriaca]MBF8189760.1 RNA polymerase subunit sigma-70 [Nonomuraea cypriaca]
MATPHHSVGGASAARASLDAESGEWVQALHGSRAERQAAIEGLHALLLRITRIEVNRRSARLSVTGPELDDLALQAADDALLAITAKIDDFQGESTFTTWAYKFVVLEVSAKIGRHFWRDPGVRLEGEDWERLPDRFGFDPAKESEWRDLLAALRRAVEEELTERQRRIFVALVLTGVPLDALAIETMFDARRKLRAVLAANGYMDDDMSRRP